MRFATTNPGKVHSLRALLESRGIDVEHLDHELTEPQTHDLTRIAIAKAHEAYERFGAHVLVQDSGYELDAWPGFPGAYVKMINETIGNEGILTLVAGRSRASRFRTVWAYHDGRSILTYDQCEHGSIADEERGELDARSLSSLWRIHIPEHVSNPDRRTLAQMSADELERHRSHAYAHSFVDWLIALDTKKRS